MVAELKVWCQPNGIVTLYEILERDNVDIRNPANFDGNSLRAYKKEEIIIEDEQNLVDFTDSSSHKSQKRARCNERKSGGRSSSDGNSRNYLSIILPIPQLSLL